MRPDERPVTMIGCHQNLRVADSGSQYPPSLVRWLVSRRHRRRKIIFLRSLTCLKYILCLSSRASCSPDLPNIHGFSLFVLQQTEHLRRQCINHIEAVEYKEIVKTIYKSTARMRRVRNLSNTCTSSIVTPHGCRHCRVVVKRFRWCELDVVVIIYCIGSEELKRD